MNTLFGKLRNAAYTYAVSTVARAKTFVRTEPVRLRAYVLSAVIAAGTVVPGLANSRATEIVVGAIVTALTVAVGEATRSKVSPVNK